MAKLSPQKELIVSTLRDLKWHCGREWLNHIKDDRKRISELNEGYMAEKGFTIVGEPCRGQICGVKDCPLFKRKAVKREINYLKVVTEAIQNSEPVDETKSWEGARSVLLKEQAASLESLQAGNEAWFEEL